MNYRDEPDFSSPTETSAPPMTGEPLNDVMQYVREYARQKPEVAALWCFGIGFILGWKLKPW